MLLLPSVLSTLLSTHTHARTPQFLLLHTCHTQLLSLKNFHFKAKLLFTSHSWALPTAAPFPCSFQKVCVWVLCHLYVVSVESHELHQATGHLKSREQFDLYLTWSPVFSKIKDKFYKGREHNANRYLNVLPFLCVYKYRKLEGFVHRDSVLRPNTPLHCPNADSCPAHPTSPRPARQSSGALGLSLTP